MATEELSLNDLARITGTERRTIRSYIAQGLLRGPDTVGRNASYSRHHLDRLRAIRVLRDQDRLGLPEIRRQFLTLGDEEIAAIAERSKGTGVAESSDEPTSALNYIRALRARLKAEPDITAGETGGAVAPAILSPADMLRDDAQLSMHRDDARPMMQFSAEEFSMRISTEEPSMRISTEEPSQMRFEPSAGAPSEFEIEWLHHTIRDLHNQSADFHARERDLRERLATSQSELEALRRASEAAAMSPLGPSALATDPGAPRMETFVRIAVRPDVEILVRGAPEDEKLKLIQEHAEHLRKALLQDGKHER